MYVDPGINTSASNLKWVLPYCKPDLPRVVGALLLFIANNTMALTIPILSGIIVDRVIVGGHVDELPRLCGLMILMTIIRVGARYGYQMWMERFGQNSVYRLVSDEYEKLHELDFTYFNHTRTGDIMSRLTSDTDAIRHCLSWVSYQIADCVVMFVGALCVMFAIDWRLALVLACVTPFIFVLTRGLSTHAHPLFFAIRNSLASLNSMVEENIEGNRVVKAFVREPYETEKFDEHNDDYMQCNMALAYNSRKYMPWLDGLGFSLQLITLGLGGFLVIKGYMTLGNLVSFNSFLWMIDGPVRQSGWLINDWQRFNASCIKIRKLLTEQPRIVEKPDAVEAVKQAVTIVEQVKHDDEATGATGAPVASGTSGAQQSTERKSCPLHIKGDIRFDHVSFAFPDDPETPILKDLDFTVPAGSKLGILGETGAGKSTLVSLISRFYDPTVGHVLIDGIDARDWPLTTLRSQVCIVAQDTFLFSDTIGGNISTNAGGMRTVKYGVTRDYVRGLEVVLADGTVMQVGGKQVKDASGISLKHLLIGSEGTLAVITKCLLRLVPKPEASLSVLVPYADLKTGIQSVLTILRANANPTAVEFMERKVVALGERFCGVSYPRPDAGSYILLTFDGRSEEVTANAARVCSLALQNGALDFIELSDARQCADIWRVRGALVKAVEAVSEQEPVDIVVPISRTADFIRFISDLEARSGMQMVSFGHAGDGNVHLCVVRGERDEETWQRELHENMDRAYAEAYRLGGVASGEHGIGLSKRPYFLRQTAKENLQAMNAIKTALDPQHILNNGKSYLTGGNNNAGTF